MVSDSFSRVQGTQEVTTVSVQCIQAGSSSKNHFYNGDGAHDSDEEEDLIVDLSTGSLKPMRLKNYVLINELVEDMQKL